MSPRSLPLLLTLTCFAADDKPAEPPKPEPKTEQRLELNLLGKVDTAAGESRRNENVQFNLIDNNALKELNVRMGTTATIVQEFRPDRGYFGVEFGNAPPSPLHIAPAKAAGLHGSAYETHNNSVFSARSFFQAGPVLPARQNDYGFSLGSPLWKGGYLSLDGAQQKIRGSVNGNILVPKPEERVPLTTDPATRRIVERFLSAYPREIPNRTDINERALNTNAPQRVDTDSGSVRLDQVEGKRDRFTVRYLFTSQRVDAFELLTGQNPDTTTKSHATRLTWERAWSAATVTTLSAGFDRIHSLLVPEPNAVGPTVSFGSVISDLGPSGTLPIDRVQNRFRYAAQERVASGDHVWTFGGEITRLQFNGPEASSNRGVVYFRNDFGRDAMTNFRLGIPSRYTTGIGSLDRGFRSWEQQYFAGDNWRASSNLSLSFGVRYQPVTGPSEINHLTEIPYTCDCNNLAPRLGVAWRLPRQWGMLRAAYGIHYGEIFPVTFQQLRWDPPNFLKLEVQAANLVNPFAGIDLGPGARSTIFDLPPGLRVPYSQQYNVSWEAPLNAPWKLQLGYVGSRTQKLFMVWFNNRAADVPGIPSTTDTINSRRRDATHYEVRRVENSSRAYFDAVRVSLALPDWRRLSVDAAYWFSKALDLGAAYTNTGGGEDIKQGRAQSEFLVSQDLKGPSSFDQSHSFLVRLNYLASRRLGHWNLSMVFLAKTGTPFTIFSGSDGPGFGNVDGSQGDRPNLLDPSVLGRSVGNPDQPLPRSAFGFIRPGETRGNLGENTFRKGGIRNLNTAISRTWSLAPEKSLTLRAESINFLNNPQFAEPGQDLTSSNFGQITNTLNDGRTFQFQLRFRF